MTTKTAEILARTETNRTLFGFTLEELQAAREAATRKIHRYEIDREIAKIKKYAKKKPAYRTDGMCQYGSGKHRRKHYTIPKKHLR